MGLFDSFRKWQQARKEAAYQRYKEKTLLEILGSSEKLHSDSKALISMTGVNLSIDEMQRFLSYAVLFLKSRKSFLEVKHGFVKQKWNVSDKQLELLYKYVEEKYFRKDELSACALLPQIAFANANQFHMGIHDFASEQDLMNYTRKLPTALRAAGWYIQEALKKMLGVDTSDRASFSWIQTQLLNPSFQHLCFRYKSSIFSILIALGKEKEAFVNHQDLFNQLRECKKFDLIPCIIPLDADDFHPLIEEYHLRNSEHDAPINVKLYSSDVLKVMSDWEILDMGVQIVRDDITHNLGRTIDSYCNIPDIDPQIWFTDKNGKRCYVVVSSHVKGNCERKKVGTKMYKHLAQYSGYYANVELFDEESNEQSVAYRGHALLINYRGLEDIEPIVLENGDDAAEMYIIRDNQ